jgi:hypothetical protein
MISITERRCEPAVRAELIQDGSLLPARSQRQMQIPCQQRSTAMPYSAQINTRTQYRDEGWPVNTIGV